METPPAYIILNAATIIVKTSEKTYVSKLFLTPNSARIKLASITTTEPQRKKFPQS